MTTKKKVQEYLAARDEGKASYAKADKLLGEIIAEMEPGESIVIGPGQTATLVDQFATKTKVWKPCGVSRFEVQVSHA